MKRVAALVTIAGIFAAKTGTAEPGSLAVVHDDATLRDRCGAGDGGLDKVARILAARRIDGLAALDQAALTTTLRDVGAPYVWPRAWIASATDEKSLDLALSKWVGAEKAIGVRRCGVARGRDKTGAFVVAAVAVDALANLAPLARHSHVGSWLSVDAHLLVSATDARAVITLPDGTTRRLLTSFADGRVLARFAPDRSGTFTVQVVADVDGGPRPVLEALVVVDAASEPIAATDDGAETACAGRSGDVAIACMIQSFRAANQLAPSARDGRLDALAHAHAVKMMQSKDLAHDAGDGDPVARLEAADLTARSVGENVAHAESALAAHRSLQASPSHRANLLSKELDRFGVAVVADADGSVWVVEEFAAGLE